MEGDMLLSVEGERHKTYKTQSVLLNNVIFFCYFLVCYDFKKHITFYLLNNCILFFFVIDIKNKMLKRIYNKIQIKHFYIIRIYITYIL